MLGALTKRSPVGDVGAPRHVLGDTVGPGGGAVANDDDDADDDDEWTTVAANISQSGCDRSGDSNSDQRGHHHWETQMLEVEPGCLLLLYQYSTSELTQIAVLALSLQIGELLRLECPRMVITIALAAVWYRFQPTTPRGRWDAEQATHR